MPAFLFCVACARIEMRITPTELENYKTICIRRITDLRNDNDFTQEYVALVLGIRQNVYARYEKGHNELPIRHLIVLSRLYDVSADYILGLSNIK